MKAVATEEYTISVTQNGAAFPGIASGGKSNADATYSDKVLICGKKAVVEKLEKANVSSAWGCLGPLGKSGAGTSSFIIAGSFTITPQSMKCSAEGKRFVTDGDFAICNCSGQDIPSAAPNTPVPFTGACKITVSNAGQNKVKGN